MHTAALTFLLLGGTSLWCLLAAWRDTRAITAVNRQEHTGHAVIIKPSFLSPISTPATDCAHQQPGSTGNRLVVNTKLQHQHNTTQPLELELGEPYLRPVPVMTFCRAGTYADVRLPTVMKSILWPPIELAFLPVHLSRVCQGRQETRWKWHLTCGTKMLLSGALWWAQRTRVVHQHNGSAHVPVRRQQPAAEQTRAQASLCLPCER